MLWVCLVIEHCKHTCWHIVERAMDTHNEDLGTSHVDENADGINVLIPQYVLKMLICAAICLLQPFLSTHSCTHLPPWPIVLGLP